MSDHPRPSRFARLLARCYPRELRAEYADELARFIDDTRRDPHYRDRMFGRAAVALRLTIDALASLCASLRNDAPRPIPTAHIDGVYTHVGSYSMNALLQDIRFALRGFIRRPAFTIIAIATLAMGIGANSAIFTLVNGVLLKGLPYPQSDRLAMVWGSDGKDSQLTISVPAFEDVRTRNRSFEELGIFTTQSVNLTGTDKPDRLIGAYSSAATLRLLGAKTVLGRIFSPEETTIGAGQLVVVLNYATWQNRFGGRNDMVGQTLILNGRPHVVIGVTSEDFREPYQSDIWLPITSAPSASWFTRNAQTVWGIGRLKSGRSLADAQQELGAIAKQIAVENNASGTTKTIVARDLHEELAGNSRFMLLVLFGAVAAVLLIVCVNIANLQLVRAFTRQREMSVRAALGANRARLISQVVIESLMLSLAGGVLGILVGQWGVKALVALTPRTVPAVASVTLDWRVVLFSFAIAIATGLLFGIPAAFAGTKTNLQSALRSRTENASTHRLNARNVLVVTELALCIVLLVTAGLFTRSMLAIQNIEAGFNGAHVLTAEFRLPAVTYNSDEKILQFLNAALEKLRAIPGVQSASFVDAVPLSGNSNSIPFVAEGQTEPAPGAAASSGYTAISDDYFRTVQIPLLAGRDFTQDDKPGTETVIIVNKLFADQVWPGQNPIGKTVRLLMKPEVSGRVVGVVGAVKQFSLTDAPSPQMYTSKMQSSGIFASVALRTVGDPDAMANALRSAIWSVDRDQPVWKVRSLQSLVDRNVSGAKFSVQIISCFALLALFLGVIGVYGVMSFAVNQRTREVGIRMALGAQGGEVQRLMLRGGVEVIAVAVAIGVAGSLAVGKFVQSQLFDVGANDPATMVAVPIILGFVAFVACWIPARRAARVDPAITLRSE